MLRKLMLLICLLLACSCACAEGEYDESFTYESGLTAVKQGEYWSLLDKNGDVLLERLLSKPLFRGKYAEVCQGTGQMEKGFSDEDVEIRRWGLIDSKGKICIPLEYRTMELINDSGTVRVQDGHWGMMNAKGKTLLDFEYSELSAFTCGRARITRHDSRGREVYGMVDEKGDIVLPAEYAHIDISENGMVIAAVRETLGEFEMDPLYGYMDLDGRWIIAPQYTDATAFEGDYAAVRRDIPNTNLHSDTPLLKRWGIINRAGEEILPCSQVSIILDEDGRGYVYRNGESMLFRIINGKLNWYHAHEDGSEELLPAWAGNWAQVVSLQTEPASYLACLPENDGSFPWVKLDASGAITETEFLEGFRGFSDGTAIICREGKCGLMNSTGEMVLEPSLSIIESYREGYAVAANKDGEYGYLDASGKWLVEPVYEYAYGFDGGYARVSGKKGMGLINTRGEVVLPLEYSNLGEIAGDNTLSAEKGGKEYVFRLTSDGAEEIPTLTNDILLEDYMPFKGSKLAKLSGEPTLEKRASEQHGHPRLDGATALFPVYAAVVEAVYPEKTRYERDYDAETLITCTKTNTAYDRLIAGDADIIFCAGPSDAQIAVAKAAGVEFELTPFGKEAFVFIVNKDNPLENITVEQIRQVYSGELAQWDALNVPGLGEIIAYQRPDNSGSQTALQRLMGDVQLMQAPAETISDGMGDILETIEYRNLPNAIGYSFRFFCTEMAGSDVKLLSIDGVAPTVENIRSDAYPITSMLYMVTRKGEENPNVQALMDWVLSEQGRKLIEKSGYVAISD